MIVEFIQFIIGQSYASISPTFPNEEISQYNLVHFLNREFFIEEDASSFDFF